MTTSRCFHIRSELALAKRLVYKPRVGGNRCHFQVGSPQRTTTIFVPGEGDETWRLLPARRVSFHWLLALWARWEPHLPQTRTAGKHRTQHPPPARPNPAPSPSAKWW